MSAQSGIAIDLLDAGAVLGSIPELGELLADAVANGASVGFMADDDPAVFEAYWRGVADAVAAGAIHLLVARGSGRILGTAQLHPAGKSNQPHRADVAKVLVHSAARRRGIGAALMREIEMQARRLGRDLLCLDTDEASPARSLYEKLGWTPVGTIPRYALMPDGGPCDATFFFKALG